MLMMSWRPYCFFMIMHNYRHIFSLNLFKLHTKIAGGLYLIVLKRKKYQFVALVQNGGSYLARVVCYCTRLIARRLCSPQILINATAQTTRPILITFSGITHYAKLICLTNCYLAKINWILLGKLYPSCKHHNKICM